MLIWFDSTSSLNFSCHHLSLVFICMPSFIFGFIHKHSHTPTDTNTYLQKRVCVAATTILQHQKRARFLVIRKIDCVFIALLCRVVVYCTSLLNVVHFQQWQEQSELHTYLYVLITTVCCHINENLINSFFLLFTVCCSWHFDKKELLLLYLIVVCT